MYQNDYEARAIALQADNDRLRGRVDQLEAALGLHYRPPLEWCLTPAESRLMGALLAREFCTKEALMAALYRNDGREEPEIKIVDIFVCKMRKKITPFGVVIHTKWGEGYWLDPANRRSLRNAA